METIAILLLFLIAALACSSAIHILSGGSFYPEHKQKIDIQPYAIGAVGEWHAARELSRLPHEFGILTDYQIPNGGNIDLIVVGPTGIFVIDAKAHYGRITLENNLLKRNGNDLEKDFFQKINNQKMALYVLLRKKMPTIHFFRAIQQVIVFVNPKIQIRLGPKQIRFTYVIGKPWLIKTILQHRGYSLNQNQIHDIVDILSKDAVIQRRPYLGISILPKTI